MKRDKILFVLPSMRPGGAEKVISFVAQNLNISKYEVKLIVIGFESEAAYLVDNIEIKYLNKRRVLFSLFDIFEIFREEKPAIVMGSIGHVNTILGLFAIFFKGIKFIGREASVLSKMSQYTKPNWKTPSFIMRFLYNNLDKIVCQSHDMKIDLNSIFNFGEKKVVTIHNPITMIPDFSNRKLSSDLLRFVTVGRLSSEKGHLRLLEILAQLKSYNFLYTIVGSGPLLMEIKENAIRLGICEKIHFVPYSDSVLKILGENDFFLQGSYVEGFPNALLESCSVGTPVIAFNAVGGTKEIIINGINGYLIEDDNEFVSVLCDFDKLKVFERARVINSVITKFDSHIILKKYEALFDALINDQLQE